MAGESPSGFLDSALPIFSGTRPSRRSARNDRCKGRFLKQQPVKARASTLWDVLAENQKRSTTEAALTVGLDRCGVAHRRWCSLRGSGAHAFTDVDGWTLVAAVGSNISSHGCQSGPSI